MPSYSNISLAPGQTVFTDEEWNELFESLRLSERESQIVQRIFDGKIKEAIAYELGISRHTVQSYIVRLYNKLGVNNQTELLVRVFLEHRRLDRR